MIQPEGKPRLALALALSVSRSMHQALVWSMKKGITQQKKEPITDLKRPSRLSFW